MMSSVIKPAKVDPEAGKEFIEGIREGLEDFAEGRYKVFKDADELLAYLLAPDISYFDPQCHLFPAPPFWPPSISSLGCAHFGVAMFIAWVC